MHCRNNEYTRCRRWQLIELEWSIKTRNAKKSKLECLYRYLLDAPVLDAEELGRDIG